MKKYLIMVIMAVAIGGTFTSCHDDSFSGTTIDRKAEAYEESFVKAFGQPDPNHTWGFGGDEAITRGEKANGNQWADPNYENLLVPPPLTAAQIAVVKKYFQTHDKLGYEDPHWTNYFMQQVYKGHTDVPQNCATPEAYMAANGSTYIIASDHMDHLAAINGDFVDHINNFNHGDCGVNDHVLDNGGNTNDGPFHSDKIMLMQNSTTASFGYYNSNGSVCRTNYTGLVSFQTIIDEMGSEANCLNDGWNRSFMGFDFEQMVDKECYANENEVWDNSTNPATFVSGTPKNLTFWGDFYINGVKQTNYVYQYNNEPVKLLSDQTNRYCGTKRTVSDSDLYTDLYDANNNNAYLGKQLNTSVIDGLLRDGYLPVDNKNYREWIKIGGCADGYFSDWIVCLTEAKTDGTVVIPSAPQVYEQWESTSTTGSTKYQIFQGATVVESGRVMCEDLGSSSLTDIDFNDIVFDAIIVREYRKLVTTNYDASGNMIGSPIESYTFTNVNNKSGYDYKYALIRLLAAGGTIPATVQGYEVHDVLGGYPTTTMINTTYDKNDVSGANIVNAQTAVDLTNDDYGRKFYGINRIKDININVLYANASKTLEAKPGAAPHKFLVPLGTPWAKERKQINLAYSEFANYVKNPLTEFWNNPSSIDTQYLYANNDLVGLSIENESLLEPEWKVYETTETSSVPTTSKRLVDATNNRMVVPASSEIRLLDYNASAPGYLYSDGTEGGKVYLTDFTGEKALQAGDVIRVYGVSIDGWEVNCTLAEKKAYASSDCGYFDIPVGDDASVATFINSHGLMFSGKHFTITYITIRRTSSTPDNTNNNNNENNSNTTLPVQIWPASGTVAEGSYAEIAGSKFIGIPANSTLKVYCTFGPDNWFNCYFNFKDYSETMPSASNWTLSGDHKQLAATTSAKSSSGDCIELVLSANAIAEFQQHTLEFHFGNITVSKITIE